MAFSVLRPHCGKTLNGTVAACNALIMSPMSAASGNRLQDDSEALRAHLAAACHENTRLRCELEEVRNLVRFNPQTLWVTDRSGRITFVSDRGPRITGLRSEELLGFGWFRLPHSDDLAPMQRAWARAVRQGRPFDIQHRIRLSDGYHRWMRSCALPHRGDAGEVIAWFGCTEDIDEQRRAEAEAHGALAQLRAVYDTAPVGLCVLDTKLRWVRINKRLADINGVPAEAHIGRTLQEVLPSINDAVEGLLRDVIETGEAKHGVELVGETPAMPGISRIWEQSFVPLRDEAGRVVGINVVAEEVTQRRRAEEALVASEARFRAMADNIPQLAWMARPDGTTFWFNRRWYGYTGSAVAQMEHRGWFDRLHPDHRERVATHLADRIAAGEAWEDTFPLRGADGTYRWFLSRAEPIHAEWGRVALWFGTHTDVTERKAAEEHRELLIHELNHRVKNTLAMVQSVAAQTLRGRCEDALWSDLQGRIFALSAAHDLLTCRNWEAVELGDLARRALRPHIRDDRPGSFAFDGPREFLEPKPALALSMALHELGTNAAKYGALSTVAGRVGVSWEVEGEELRLTWHESCGPRVVPPQRRGFGSRLIERGLAAELNGTAELLFHPDGVICRISMPRCVQP